MFEGFTSELVFVGLVALIVIGPKDLPKAMRVVGKWVGRARGIMRQFRSGFDDMIRESELAEMEKKWAAENERIMREFPSNPLLPAPHPVDATVGMPVDENGAVIMDPVAPATPEPTPAAPKPRRRAPRSDTSAETFKPAPAPAPARKPRARAKP